MLTMMLALAALTIVDASPPSIHSEAVVHASGPGRTDATDDRRTVSPRSMIRLRGTGRVGPPATIAQLAWLEGSWIGEMPQGLVEHVILPARAGHMPSFVRALAGDKVGFYEISVFAEAAGSVVNRVKHFTPELAGWEAQSAYAERALVERDGYDLYFDGLTISRTGPDSFTVYFLERRDGREGNTLVIAFRRVASGGN